MKNNKAKKPAPNEADKIEIHPDAKRRFEKAVDAALHTKPVRQPSKQGK